jgi:tRNA A-37 threonylcarbamoyl transferase component Bud32
MVPRIAGRYHVEGELGRGGAGRVYAVVDERTERRLALKRVPAEIAAQKPFLVQLLKSEYRTLVQLSHPRIVEVYDFGVDEGSPYYTMELLDGSDLEALAPLEFRAACALLRDIALSLVVMHARRFVHRDITPSNVRRTSDGRAKLIDFGAMTAMGNAETLVGTPAFLAPEALRSQPIDGRADLFALGALAYWLLSRRLAFPARSFGELEKVWEQQPRSLRELGIEVPPELDALVLSLLSLDTFARPASAVEVIERLSAIADLPNEEQLLAQAHLAAPALVGQGDVLKTFALALSRAQRGQGGVWLIEGAAGAGKSRVLERCALDAKLSGACVLSASAEDARGDFGVVRALRERFYEANGEHPSSPDAGRAGAREHDAEGLEQLCARDQSLVLAIDDLDDCDEPSLAALASLSRVAAEQRILIIATLGPETAQGYQGPLRKLRERAKLSKLAALEFAQTSELLQSIFGAADNLANVARWAHGHALGNPRVTLDLVRHLLDHGLVRYEGGGFRLPDSLADSGLPSSLEQALAARIARLSPDALWLGAALARAEGHVPIEADDLALLFTGEARERAQAALGELLSADILKLGRYGPLFVQPGVVVALCRETEAVAGQLHRALAELLRAPGYAAPLVVAHHLQRAGAQAEALELLLACAAAPASRAERDQLPMTERIACYVAAEEECRAQRRSPHELLSLQTVLARLAAGYDLSLVKYAHQAIARLRHDTGLVYWDALAQVADPVERIKRCIGKARQVHEGAEAAARGLPPPDAMRNLAEVVLLAMAAESRTLRGLDAVAALPPLLEPFAPLSPSIRLLWMVTQGIVCKDIGAATELWYESALAQLEQQDMSVSSDVKAVLLFSLGCDGAGLSPAQTLARAQQLAEDPWFATMADEVRLLSHLYAGDTRAAALCRERRDACPPALRAWLKRAQLLEVQALAASQDLLQLKALAESIREQARQLPGFEAVYHWARGEYRRLRDQPHEALEALEACLARVEPGKHVVWGHAAPSFIATLVDLGHGERAHEYAQWALAEARRFDLARHLGVELELAAARAEAAVGSAEAGSARAERLLSEAQESGASPVVLARICETLLLIALRAEDVQRFERYERELEQHCKATKRSRLITRHRLLRRSGRQQFYPERASIPGLPDKLSPTAWMTRVREELLTTRVASLRALRALTILLDAAESDQGYFFAHGEQGLSLAASQGVPAPSEALLAAAMKEVERALGDYGETDVLLLDQLPTSTAADEPIEGPDGLSYRLLPLSTLTPEGPRVVGVVAVQTTLPLSRLMGAAGVIGEVLLAAGL